MVAASQFPTPEHIRVEVTQTMVGQWRWRLFDGTVEVSGGAGYDTEWEAQHDADGAQEAYTAYSQACQFDLEQYSRVLAAERPAFYRRVMEALGQREEIRQADPERLRRVAAELRRRLETEPDRSETELARPCPKCGMRSWLMSGRCINGHGPYAFGPFGDVVVEAPIDVTWEDDAEPEERANALTILAQFRRLLARRRRYAAKNPDSSGQAVPHAIDQILHALTWLFPAAEGK